MCHHPMGVSRRFPNDVALVEMEIESYRGVPLVAPDGEHLGIWRSSTRGRCPRNRVRRLIFRIFAARAAAELARLRLEQSLA